ncbi:hypothetical protein, partial [Elizabethkingia anophelis]|uniref:hypothetical protein n=2 Tax=Elizabethkingia anophelis TaxID=1117645 RepID=UPI003892BAD8
TQRVIVYRHKAPNGASHMKNYVFLYYHNMRNQKDALKELGLDEKLACKEVKCSGGILFHNRKMIYNSIWILPY